MTLSALGLINGGAILVSATTGIPLAIEPGLFRDADDAARFIGWAGDLCDNVMHVRSLVKRWRIVRNWPCCPDCEHGRVEPGEQTCEVCLDRPLNDHQRSADREGVEAR